MHPRQPHREGAVYAFTSPGEDPHLAPAGDHPAAAIATTTLELDIDIGKVKCVAQQGPAPSVASLQQRVAPVDLPHIDGEALLSSA